jgi:hypothetical protein
VENKPYKKNHKKNINKNPCKNKMDSKVLRSIFMRKSHIFKA